MYCVHEKKKRKQSTTRNASQDEIGYLGQMPDICNHSKFFKVFNLHQLAAQWQDPDHPPNYNDIQSIGYLGWVAENFVARWKTDPLVCRHPDFFPFDSLSDLLGFQTQIYSWLYLPLVLYGCVVGLVAVSRIYIGRTGDVGRYHSSTVFGLVGYVCVFVAASYGLLSVVNYHNRYRHSIMSHQYNFMFGLHILALLLVMVVMCLAVLHTALQQRATSTTQYGYTCTRGRGESVCAVYYEVRTHMLLYIGFVAAVDTSQLDDQVLAYQHATAVLLLVTAACACNLAVASLGPNGPVPGGPPPPPLVYTSGGRPCQDRSVDPEGSRRSSGNGYASCWKPAASPNSTAPAPMYTTTTTGQGYHMHSPQPRPQSAYYSTKTNLYYHPVQPQPVYTYPCHHHPQQLEHRKPKPDFLLRFHKQRTDPKGPLRNQTRVRVRVREYAELMTSVLLVAGAWVLCHPPEHFLMGWLHSNDQNSWYRLVLQLGYLYVFALLVYIAVCTVNTGRRHRVTCM